MVTSFSKLSLKNRFLLFAGGKRKPGTFVKSGDKEFTEVITAKVTKLSNKGTKFMVHPLSF